VATAAREVRTALDPRLVTDSPSSEALQCLPSSTRTCSEGADAPHRVLIGTEGFIVW
jgi:hypothetical protein